MAHKKRNEDTHNKVYRYGARPPSVNLDRVRNQLKLATDYYNSLVENERARRQRWHDILGEDPKVAEARTAAETANDKVEEAFRILKDARCETGKRRPDHKLAQTVATEKRKRRRAWAAQKKAEAKAQKTLKDKLRASDDAAKVAKKALRAEFSDAGLYWGTYLITEDALPIGGPPPKFRRRDGTGSIAAQCQITAKDENVYQLHDVPDWRSRRPGKILKIRIGSMNKAGEIVKGGSVPLWAEIPLLYHRPIPEGATVKWVRVVLRKVGTREEWSVCFTVELPGKVGRVEKKATCSGRVIAFDLGWRKTDRGLRVAYGTGSNGRSYELLLPLWLVEGWEVSRRLRSIRDRMFDDIRDRLSAWRRGRDLPEWLEERLRFSSRWKGQVRLITLLRFWEDNRFEGDASIIAEIQVWRAEDTHLYNWERHQERRCLHQRRELYRHWGKWVALNYDAVAFEDLDLSALKEKPGIEEDQDGVVGLHMKGAAGELRTAIEQACIAEGKRALRVEHKGSSGTCAACGEVAMDITARLKATCEACGKEADRDCNASRILLSRARGDMPRKIPGVLAVPKEAWYQRLMAVPRRVEVKKIEEKVA